MKCLQWGCLLLTAGTLLAVTNAEHRIERRDLLQLLGFGGRKRGRGHSRGRGRGPRGYGHHAPKPSGPIPYPVSIPLRPHTVTFPVRPSRGYGSPQGGASAQGGHFSGGGHGGHSGAAGAQGGHSSGAGGHGGHSGDAGGHGGGGHGGGGGGHGGSHGGGGHSGGDNSYSGSSPVQQGRAIDFAASCEACREFEWVPIPGPAGNTLREPKAEPLQEYIAPEVASKPQEDYSAPQAVVQNNFVPVQPQQGYAQPLPAQGLSSTGSSSGYSAPETQTITISQDAGQFIPVSNSIQVHQQSGGQTSVDYGAPRPQDVISTGVAQQLPQAEISYSSGGVQQQQGGQALDGYGPPSSDDIINGPLPIGVDVIEGGEQQQEIPDGYGPPAPSSLLSGGSSSDSGVSVVSYVAGQTIQSPQPSEDYGSSAISSIASGGGLGGGQQLGQDYGPPATSSIVSVDGLVGGQQSAQPTVQTVVSELSAEYGAPPEESIITTPQIESPTLPEPSPGPVFDVRNIIGVQPATTQPQEVSYTEDFQQEVQDVTLGGGQDVSFGGAFSGSNALSSQPSSFDANFGGDESAIVQQGTPVDFDAVFSYSEAASPTLQTSSFAEVSQPAGVFSVGEETSTSSDDQGDFVYSAPTDLPQSSSVDVSAGAVNIGGAGSGAPPAISAAPLAVELVPDDYLPPINDAPDIDIRSRPLQVVEAQAEEAAVGATSLTDNLLSEPELTLPVEAQVATPANAPEESPTFGARLRPLHKSFSKTAQGGSSVGIEYTGGATSRRPDTALRTTATDLHSADIAPSEPPPEAPRLPSHALTYLPPVPAALLRSPQSEDERSGVQGPSAEFTNFTPETLEETFMNVMQLTQQKLKDDVSSLSSNDVTTPTNDVAASRNTSADLMIKGLQVHEVIKLDQNQRLETAPVAEEDTKIPNGENEGTEEPPQVVEHILESIAGLDSVTEQVSSNYFEEDSAITEQPVTHSAPETSSSINTEQDSKQDSKDSVPSIEVEEPETTIRNIQDQFLNMLPVSLGGNSRENKALFRVRYDLPSDIQALEYSADPAVTALMLAGGFGTKTLQTQSQENVLSYDDSPSAEANSAQTEDPNSVSVRRADENDGRDLDTSGSVLSTVKVPQQSAPQSLTRQYGTTRQVPSRKVSNSNRPVKASPRAASRALNGRARRKQHSKSYVFLPAEVSSPRKKQKRVRLSSHLLPALGGSKKDNGRKTPSHQRVLKPATSVDRNHLNFDIDDSQKTPESYNSYDDYDSDPDYEFDETVEDVLSLLERQVQGWDLQKIGTSASSTVGKSSSLAELLKGLEMTNESPRRGPFHTRVARSQLYEQTMQQNEENGNEGWRPFGVSETEGEIRKPSNMSQDDMILQAAESNTVHNRPESEEYLNNKNCKLNWWLGRPSSSNMLRDSMSQISAPSTQSKTTSRIKEQLSSGISPFRIPATDRLSSWFTVEDGVRISPETNLDTHHLLSSNSTKAKRHDSMTLSDGNKLIPVAEKKERLESVAPGAPSCVPACSPLPATAPEEASNNALPSEMNGPGRPSNRGLRRLKSRRGRRRRLTASQRRRKTRFSPSSTVAVD